MLNLPYDTSACGEGEPITMELDELYRLAAKQMSVDTRWTSGRATPLCHWQDTILRVGPGRKRSTCWLEPQLGTFSLDLGRATRKRTPDVVRPPPCVGYLPSASSPEKSLSPQSQAGYHASAPGKRS